VEGDVIFDGESVAFESTLDGAQNVAVNATDTFFGGAVGGGTPLASLTTDAPGETVIAGGVVNTTGDQTYNDEVLIAADTVLTSSQGNVIFGDDVNGFVDEAPELEVLLQAPAPGLVPSGHSLEVVAAEDVRVGGDIGTENPLRSVSLESNTSGNNEGDVIFDGSGDQTVHAVESITLNTNRASVPDTATIYKTFASEGSDPGSLVFEVTASDGTFAMTQNDKLSVPEGELIIRADEEIRFGDLNALDRVLLEGFNTTDTGQATALTRGNAPVLIADGSSKTDNGIEIISNKIQIFASTIAREGGGPLYVATPDGDEAQGIGTGEAIQRAFRESFRALTSDDFVNPNDPDNGPVLDQIATGPGFLPLDVIPYIPSEEEKNPSGTANRNAVAERPLRPDELLSFFDCMEKTEDKRFECEEEYVGTERAASPEAEKLRALAADLFVDSAAGESPEERDKRILENAVVAYKSGTGAGRVEGEPFRRFVETNPAQADALAILDKYGELLQGVREFGATDEAYQALKSTKLQRITPSGLSTEELGNAVEAGMTARPVETGVRVASSDRFYLFRGLESQRLYLMERPQPAVE
jgi:hypothetical protein